MLKKLQGLFARLVRHVEEHPTPLQRYFQLFFAILAVRLCLEFFSSHRLFSLTDVMHIGLWFSFIVLAFLLQLFLFSGESLLKVTKLVVVGFTIALTAPIIDLVVTGGVGAKMNYLTLNNWGEIMYAYVTIGGPSVTRGATWGIRLEIILLVLASFNYVRMKRGSALAGMAAGLSIYTVLFLSGGIPAWLELIRNAFALQYGPGDQSTILFLLALDLILLAGIIIAYSPRQAVAIYRRLPWGSVGIAVLHLFIGIALARREYGSNWELNPTTLLGFPLLLALGLALGGMWGLQILQIDGKWPAIKAGRARNFLLGTSLVIGFALGEHVVFVVAVIWGLMFLLNEPPLNLRRAPLLRNVLEVLLLAAFALLGFTAFGGPMVGFPLSWLVLLTLVQFLGSLFLDQSRRDDAAWSQFASVSTRFKRILGAIAGILAVLALLLTTQLYVEFRFARYFSNFPMVLCIFIRLMPRRNWSLVILWPVYLLLVVTLFA